MGLRWVARTLHRGLAERGAVEANNRKDENAKFVNLGLFLQSRPSSRPSK